MTPSEAVMLTRYVRACCPQQAIDEYTADAWHDLLGDLDLAACRDAVAAVARTKPFVAPAEIRAAVTSARRDRLAVIPVPAPDPETAADPVRYRHHLAAEIRRIADGRSVRRALAADRPESRPPQAAESYLARFRALASGGRKLTGEALAAQQAGEFSAARQEAAEGETAACAD